jgi:hypothetical protein
MELTKKQILENKELLKEDTLENILMVAGFVPVIGEIADIILIIRYVMKKEYLFAGLMLIALIPTVGDFIAKPFIRFLRGSGVAGKIALKSSDEMVEFLAKNPKMQAQYAKMGQYFTSPSITKTISQVEKVPGMGPKWANGMRQAVAENTSVLARLKQPINMGKAVGKEIAAGGKFSTGFKTFFRDQALAKYVAKKGMEPSNWLSKWWYVVRRGRKDRRDMVKYFVMANGLLATFGLPSFADFEDKMTNDAEFREKLANDPKFSKMVSGSVDSNELAQIEGGSTSDNSSSGGGLLGAGMSLGMLKTLAKMAL